MSFVGAYIRKRRIELDLNQKEVAEKLGFTAVFLGRVEKGKCSIPIKYVNKLSKILKTDSEKILLQIKKDISETMNSKLM